MGERIGIVGAGIAGLTAAAELRRAGHEVTVFEAGSHVGGHTDTHEIETEAGSHRVDTGFIVMNDRNYPNFSRLLAELDVETQRTEMSFGVSDDAGRFEWCTRGLGGVFAQPSNVVNPRFLRMLADIPRFNRKARPLVGTRGGGPSLRAFLEQEGLSEYFIERLLVPQAASVWSTDPERMWSFPAALLAEFFHNHGTLQMRDRPRWRTVVGGSATYVRALTAPFSNRILTGTPVHSIERGPDNVTLRYLGGESEFDQVVVAVHSDQALAMLERPTRAEREILGAIPYQHNETVLHTDTSLMPNRRRAWASWNFHLAGPPGEDRTTLTYDMNRLQRIESRTDFLVTLNRTDAIDPAKVLRVRDYSHPMFTEASLRAQDRWAEISGTDRIHYCGAYWRWGFHEDGCWSGLRVSRALGGRGPGLEGAVPASIGNSPAEPLAAVR
jgi:predicted NAD/FAD-binding protein